MVRRTTDDLDDFIAERAAKNPAFPAMVEGHLLRRRLQRALGERRQAVGLGQSEVARRMGTSQSAVARVEADEIDANLSTLQRFATAIGCEIEFSLAPGRRLVVLSCSLVRRAP